MWRCSVGFPPCRLEGGAWGSSLRCPRITTFSSTLQFYLHGHREANFICSLDGVPKEGKDFTCFIKIYNRVISRRYNITLSRFAYSLQYCYSYYPIISRGNKLCRAEGPKKTIKNHILFYNILLYDIKCTQNKPNRIYNQANPIIILNIRFPPLPPSTSRNSPEFVAFSNICIQAIKKVILIMSYLKELWEQLAEKKGKESKQPKFRSETLHEGYRTIPIQNLERKQPKPMTNLKGSEFWTKNRKLLTYSENCKLTHSASNGFFDCFYQAYMNHGDIMVKPDDLWLIIMLWFTKYVDDNAEELRRAFVSHQGKKKLTVNTRSMDQSDWSEFFEGIIVAIRKNTNQGVTQNLECNFSSSGLFEKTFSTAIIMNSFKKYFDYERGMGGCGIQNAHLGGTLQDWQLLLSKLLKLKVYDVNGQLKKYVNGLTPVIEQFIETYKGYAHVEFWNNIYDERKEADEMQYMPSNFVVGWLIKFFTTRDQVSDDLQVEEITVDINLKNNFTGQERMVALVGGTKGYSVHADIYRPHYSFAIVEKPRKYTFKAFVPKPSPVRQTLKLSKVSFGDNPFLNLNGNKTAIHRGVRNFTVPKK